MDAWQIERQVKYLVAAATWSDSPSATILTGASVVSPDGLGNFLPGVLAGDEAENVLPFAIVSTKDSTIDANPGGRVELVRVQVIVVAGGSGITNGTGNVASVGSHGQEAVVGSTRAVSGPQGKSTGRGVDEVVTELLQRAFCGGLFTDSATAMQGQVVSVGPVIPVDGSQVVARAIDLEVYNSTTARRYHSARLLRATGGAGQVALAWTLPPARYDRLRVIVRRSAAGGAYPTSPTDGTAVTLSGDLTTGVTVTGLVAGTYKLAVFVAYDETGSGTEERYSDAVTASVAVT